MDSSISCRPAVHRRSPRNNSCFSAETSGVGVQPGVDGYEVGIVRALRDDVLG